MKKRALRLFFLLALKGKKGNDSCFFDSFGKFSLVLSADTGHTAGKNFPFFRNELFELSGILIVDMFGFFHAEGADFFSADSSRGFFNFIFFHVKTP